jgi:hypothetical protein
MILIGVDGGGLPSSAAPRWQKSPKVYVTHVDQASDVKITFGSLAAQKRERAY